MKASDIMTRRVVATNENAMCIDLARKILSGFFSGLPVVDNDGAVVGVVSEIDILRQLDQNPDSLFTTPTKNVMKSPAICVDEDDSIAKVMETILKNGFVRVPVVKAGRLVGIISRSDLLRSFLMDDFVVFDSGQVAVGD